MHRIILYVSLLMLLLLIFISVPVIALNEYGSPASGLPAPRLFWYSARLLWDDGLLKKPVNPVASPLEFEIRQGEPISSICNRLADLGLVSNASLVRDYLVYTGLDSRVQAGRYQLSAAMSVIDITRKIQDATAAELRFVVLPGWRIEEIEATLPSSGLNITPEEFREKAQTPPMGFSYLEGAVTTEGFLFPDSYILARETTTDGLIQVLIRNFVLHLTSDMMDGYSREGLTVYQGVTLASIVQREAIRLEEAPLIASVYLNRLESGMRLEADPTVQYAIGYNVSQSTWWTNPLSLDDLKLQSVYNTYTVEGLPPSPISNPGLEALRAVAFATETPYFFFSARCDGSGYHSFSQTFSEHLQHLCD